MIEYHAKENTSDYQAFDWLGDLALNLRKSDRDELAATIPLPPGAILAISYDQSELAWIGVADGKPVVAFGLDGDCCWMLGAPDIESGRLARQVARDTERFQATMLARSPTIWNWVDLRNDRSIRWLIWAGFTVEQINMEHGPERRPFVKLSRTIQ